MTIPPFQSSNKHLASGADGHVCTDATELPLEQEIPCQLDFAREATGFDRLVLWAKVPSVDRLVYVSSSGLDERDRRALGASLEIPLSKAGALGKAYRERASDPHCGRELSTRCKVPSQASSLGKQRAAHKQIYRRPPCCSRRRARSIGSGQ